MQFFRSGQGIEVSPGVFSHGRILPTADWDSYVMHYQRIAGHGAVPPPHGFIEPNGALRLYVPHGRILTPGAPLPPLHPGMGGPQPSALPGPGDSHEAGAFAPTELQMPIQAPAAPVAAQGDPGLAATERQIPAPPESAQAAPPAPENHPAAEGTPGPSPHDSPAPAQTPGSPLSHEQAELALQFFRSGQAIEVSPGVFSHSRILPTPDWHSYVMHYQRIAGHGAVPPPHGFIEPGGALRLYVPHGRILTPGASLPPLHPGMGGPPAAPGQED